MMSWKAILFVGFEGAGRSEAKIWNSLARPKMTSLNHSNKKTNSIINKKQETRKPHQHVNWSSLSWIIYHTKH